MIEIVCGCCLSGEEVVICALKTGQLVCIDKIEGCDGLKLLQNELITILYNQNQVFIASTTWSVPLSELSLKFKDPEKAKSRWFANPQTPVLFGKDLPVALHGPMKNIKFLELSEQVVVTIHSEFIVFHSVHDVNSPHAIIGVDDPIIDVSFGWEQAKDLPLNMTDRSYSHSVMKFALLDFFSVSILTETKKALQSVQEIAHVSFLPPPVGNLHLPKAMADALCLLYDVSKSDRQSPLKNLFATDTIISRKSDTTVFVKSLYHGFIRPDQIITIPSSSNSMSIMAGPSEKFRTFEDLCKKFTLEKRLTPGPVYRLVPVDQRAREVNSTLMIPTKIPRPLQKHEIPLSYKTIANQAFTKVNELGASGLLATAFKRGLMDDKNMGPEERTLQFCRTLQNVVHTIIQPLERYTAALVRNTRNSIDSEFPEHTCFMRARQKSLLEQITISVLRNKNKEAEIDARISKIRKTQEVLTSKYNEFMTSYYKILREESLKALIRVMDDYVNVYGPNISVLPNVPGILKVLNCQDLDELAQKVRPFQTLRNELMERPDSRELNLYWSIHNSIEQIKKILIR